MGQQKSQVDSTVETSTESPRTPAEIMEALKAESKDDTQEVVNGVSSAVRKGKKFGRYVEQGLSVAEGSVPTSTNNLTGRAARFLPIYVPSPEKMEQIVDNAKSLGKKYLGYTDAQIKTMDGVDAYNVIESGMASNPDSEIVKSVEEKIILGENKAKMSMDNEPTKIKRPSKIKTLPQKQEESTFATSGPSNEYMDINMDDYLVTSMNASEVQNEIDGYGINIPGDNNFDDKQADTSVPMSSKRAELEAATQELGAKIAANAENQLDDLVFGGGKFF